MMEIQIKSLKDKKCECEGCDQPAENIIVNRNNNETIMAVCSWHCEEIALQNRAEYDISCPNCGCCIPCN